VGQKFRAAKLSSSSLKSRMRLKLNFGLKSTEGLTEDGRSASKMAHFQDCWQEASFCHCIFGRSSQFLTSILSIELLEGPQKLTSHRPSDLRQKEKITTIVSFMTYPEKSNTDISTIFYCFMDQP
jgi:hypothetical protein